MYTRNVVLDTLEFRSCLRLRKMGILQGWRAKWYDSIERQNK